MGQYLHFAKITLRSGSEGLGLVPATHLVLDGKPIESQVGSIDIP